MNLESEIRQVRGRLSSPSRLDSNDDRITDLEIIDWIHKGEIQVLKDMAEREKVTTVATFTADAAELQGAATDFPTDILDIVRVVHDGVECKRIPLREVGATAENSLYEPIAGYQQYYYQLARANGTVNIGILPAPSTGDVDVYYVKIPTRRFKHRRGYTTNAGANAQELIDNTLAQVDGYWNGTEVRLLKGDYEGQERTITDWTLTGTILDVGAGAAFPAIIAAEVTFDMGEVSQIPPDFQDLVIVWATYVGLLKDKEVQMAQATRDEYQHYLDMVNQRYGFTREEPGRQPETAKTL